MKYKVATWRITWRFLLASLFVFLALIGMASSLFFGAKDGKIFIQPFGVGQILLLSVFFGLSIGFYIITINNFYYTIDKHSFSMKKFSKTYEFDYKSIEFIDIEESKKKGLVIFYTPRGKLRYLLGDKDGVLLDTLIKKCPNIMSIEEFRRAHPEEKY